MTSGQRRSDAHTNIARILGAARRVFGLDGNAPLSRVAAEAGVAEATLYRHFPNRQALAAKVYEHIFLTEIKPPVLALRPDAPREAFIDTLMRLQDVLYEQRALLASLDGLANITVQLIMYDRGLFEDMVVQAQVAGSVRADVTADDVATFVAMVVTTSVAMNQSAHQRRRHLHLMVDALSAAAQPLSDPPDIRPGDSRRSRPT